MRSPAAAAQIAAVLTGPRAVELRETAPPSPEPNQVVIRLEGSGVCGSDLPAWEGRPWTRYPLEPGGPGHEGWGVVEEVGPRVTRIAPGRRVAVISHHAYARYGVADESAVVALPDEVTGPFPGEAVGCAMNVWERARATPEHTIAVVGIGFIGALLVRLAASWGARVIALSRRDFALKVALSAGASEVIELSEDNAASAVEELTSGEMCDVVIEAAGKQQTLDVAAALVKVRGHLVIAGYHQDGPRTVDMQSWNWRGLDVTNAHERDVSAYVAGVTRGARAVADGTLDVASLITHEFELDRLGDAFDIAIERPEGFLKAVVRA
ncbi:MAG TPA: zinc-binding dehydrogenase [Actinomycetota bacterium]|nr:zinc-binding dehydrogenase [Actinomycetota bacterium]